MYNNGSSIHNLPRIRTYEEADQFFKRTKPLRSRKYDAESVRPLHPKRGGSYMKYRLEHKVKYGRSVYDLMLYRTPVIRYFKPEADGSYFVSIRAYHSLTTHKFTDWHRWGSGNKQFDTTDGKIVFVPYGSAYDDGLRTSAVLHFNPQGLLDVPNSWHAPFFKLFVSDDDKKRRAMFKAKVDSLLDYVAVSRSTVEELAASGGWREYAFNRHAIAHDIALFVQSDNPEACVEHKTLEGLLNMAASKLQKRARRHARYEYWHKKRMGQESDFIHTTDFDPIVASVRDDIMATAGYMTKTRKEILPMFAEEYKGKFYMYRDYDMPKFSEQALILRPLV